MAKETQKALKHLRANGYLAEVVEKTIPKTFIKKDLWGFVDVLAVKEGQVLGVQVTSRSNVSSRVKKIREHENYAAVMASPIAIEVWGFEKGTVAPTRVVKMEAA